VRWIFLHWQITANYLNKFILKSEKPSELRLIFCLNSYGLVSSSRHFRSPLFTFANCNFLWSPLCLSQVFFGCQLPVLILNFAHFGFVIYRMKDRGHAQLVLSTLECTLHLSTKSEMIIGSWAWTISRVFYSNC